MEKRDSLTLKTLILFAITKETILQSEFFPFKIYIDILQFGHINTKLRQNNEQDSMGQLAVCVSSHVS